MQTAVVMIILTVLPGGDISSSFVDIDTQEECRTRLQRIEPILRNGKIEVKEADVSSVRRSLIISTTIRQRMHLVSAI